jgi:outer membrane protein OmpA-like peptidoglycan-associated protein
MKGKKILLSCALAIVGATSAASAQDILPEDNGIWTYHTPPRWRESEAHPLRVAAYIVHPVGWALREAIFRPWSYFAGSTKLTRSVFGFREPFDYRKPICFVGSDEIPDCHKLAPLANLGGPEGEDDGSLMQTTQEQVVFPDIAFDFDKSHLNELGRGRVRQVAKLLQSVPSINVVVEGHTDIIGTEAYNMKLGERRAQTVIKELTELGIDPKRMSPISYGEARPVFTETDAWARAVNRRVQFSIQGQGVNAPPPVAASDTLPKAVH